jgi:hypothetical protein
MKANNFRYTRLVIDSLSTPSNIVKLVATSENDSLVAVGRKEIP